MQDGQLVEGLRMRPLPPGMLGAGSAARRLATLAVAAERVRRQILSAHPGARVPLEGWTRLAVDSGPQAYQLGFRAPVGPGATLIGKRYLVPDPDRPGEGLQIEIVEQVTRPAVIRKLERSPAGFFLHWPIQVLLEDAAAVSTSRGLEGPLRSFRFR